ncbi:PAS domain S-box protein [Desertifilum sp. FACHB-1129]|uniref:PAS domain S-box protein n=1 Tax=Desertifilum tharense TaxID=1185873 RepID=UPI0019888383|nr:PAS domain S-box protein [Desertifilum sp. FACHB-1129]MDA0211146.1 PAS domain S-box protein [Cyanobacteria bacterium FC1]
MPPVKRFTIDRDIKIQVGSHHWSSASLDNSEANSPSLKNTLSILLNSPCPMLMVWGSDRLLFYNEALCNLLGEHLLMPLGQSLNAYPTPIGEAIHPDIEQVLIAGQPHHREDCCFLISHFTASYSPLWDESDRLIGVFATLTSPASPTLSERFFSRPEANLEIILSSIQEQFIVLDCNWRYTFINQRVVEATHLSQTELLGQNIWDLFPDLRGSEFYIRLHQAQATQTQDRFEYFYASRQQWFENRIYPSEMGVTLLVSDITARKQAEAALSRSEARFRRIFECNAIGMGVWTRSGAITEANNALLQIIGYTQQELETGQIRWPDLTPPEYRELDRLMLDSINQKGVVGSFEKEYIHKDGHRVPILVGGASFNDTSDSGFFFAIDLSDRREMERRLAAQYAVVRVLAEATHFSDAVPAILQSLCETLDWQLGIIWSIDRETNVLRYVNHWQAPQLDLQDLIETSQRMTFAPGIGLPGRVWSSGQPLMLDARADSPPHENRLKARSAAQAQLRTAFGFPILLGDERLGVIECFSDRLLEPQADLLQMMLAMGSQMGQFMERKRAEDALRRREEELRLITNAVPALISYVDRQQCYRFNNRSYEQWFGCSSAEFYGTPIHQMMGDEAYQGILPYVEQALAGESVNFETQLTYPRAGKRYASVSYTPHINDRGEVEGFVVLVNDISDRKQTELALRESRALFESFMQHVPGCAYIKDEQGRYVYANAIGTRLTGRSLEELIGKTDFELLDAEYAQLFRDTDLEVLRTNQPVERLERFLHEDGEHMWMALKFPFVDASGQRLIAGMSFDVTDRKRAEDALQESERRYRILAEAIPQLVWITTSEGPTEYINQKFCDYTGLDLEQMQQLGWQSIVHPEDWPIERERWQAATENSTFYEAQYRIRQAHGSYRWFLVRGIPLKNDQQQAVRWFGTCTDIEQQKQLEAERGQLLQQEQAARAEAEAANRIKDEFLAVLSHELRSPLNPILGWAQLLRSRQCDESTLNRALETIERNARLQAQLIEDLLDVSRILRGKMSLQITPVPLASAVEAAIETVRLAAESKGIQIDYRCQPVEPIIGDAGRLQQAVWNLLANAVKFTPPGGRIEITLEQIDGHAQIQVKDTGIGIQPSFLPHVFEYFRQADGTTTRKFGGLGLGLAIVRHVVELHGGVVQAESLGEHQGSIFTLSLPLPQPSSRGLRAEENVASVPQEAISLEGIEILVVDDDPDTREFIAFILREAGANVTEVASAIAALSALCHKQPHILISDIGMPDMDGYALMRQVRSRSVPQEAQIQAIALTAYAGERNQQAALAAGFQAHLAKPVDPTQLIATVAQFAS